MNNQLVITNNPITVEMSGFGIQGPAGGGGGSWGTITGTLSAQTDLQAALDAKLESANFDGGNAASILIEDFNIDGGGA
jgi:hypothetical protein